MGPRFFNILVLFIIYKTIIVHADVDQLKHSDDLDPINDSEASEHSEKDHDKRTIFKNALWHKQRPVKFIIGYGAPPIRPVLRPVAIKHLGYHYNRPKIHFHLKRPVIHVPQIRPLPHNDWKPIIKPVTIVKPAPVPIHLHQGIHVDQLHLNPVPHIDHIHKEPVVHAPHVHPVPVVPHVHPLPQLYEVAKPDLGVLPLGATFPTTAIKEIPAPQLVPQPVAPAPVHVHPVAPVAPVAPLFPAPIHPIAPAHFGTISHFQTPGHVFPLNPLPVHHPVGHVDHIHHGDHAHAVGHLNPHIHPVTHLHPVGHLGHAHPVGVGHLDHIHPVGHLDQVNHGDHAHLVGHLDQIQHVHPLGDLNHVHHVDHAHLHPGPAPHIDYHEHPVQNLLPNHYHLQYPQIPQDVHHNQQEAHHQFQEHPQVYQQQLPSVQHNQQEGNIQDNYPYHQEERYQPANQASAQHFYRQGQFEIGQQGDNQGYVYSQPQGRLIQPGQTDLQFPLQLPHHPAFDQDSRPEGSQQSNVFKPSIQLEAPYKK